MNVEMWHIKKAYSKETNIARIISIAIRKFYWIDKYSKWSISSLEKFEVILPLLTDTPYGFVISVYMYVNVCKCVWNTLGCNIADNATVPHHFDWILC